MFTKQKNSIIQDLAVDTLLGNNTRFEGTIIASGTVRIDGFVKGNVDVDGTIALGETGKVLGDIHATDLICAGRVQGNLYIREKTSFMENAAIIGDINTNFLSMPQGVYFKGSCNMTGKEDVVSEFIEPQN